MSNLGDDFKAQFGHSNTVRPTVSKEQKDEELERQEMWRTSNFLIDEFDYTVQRNDKRMQEVMHLDFYTVTFYSLRTKVKKEYRLLTSDSAEYYNEAMFIMGLQNVFCFSYMFYDTDFSELFCYMNDYSVNLCIMFTCLVLHFSCL